MIQECRSNKPHLQLSQNHLISFIINESKLRSDCVGNNRYESSKTLKSGTAIVGMSIPRLNGMCRARSLQTVKAGTGAAIEPGGLITGQDIAAWQLPQPAERLEPRLERQEGRSARTGHPRPAKSLQPSDCHAKAGDREGEGGLAGRARDRRGLRISDAELEEMAGRAEMRKSGLSLRRRQRQSTRRRP